MNNNINNKNNNSSNSGNSNSNNSKKHKGFKRIYITLAIVCGVAAAFAGGFLVRKQTQESKAAEEYEVLLEETQTAKPQVTVKPAKPKELVEEKVDLSAYDVPEKNIDFDALREENEDIYAWITIPDTNIDYPILQHPDELDYYLNRNLDGSTGYPGCIYSQFLNDKDFSDFNTVLYGHNMKAGTMFANLHYYEDEEFFDAHPYVYVYTEDGPLVYQVFAAYAFANLHLLMGFDLSDESVRQVYIDNIFAMNGLTDHVNDKVKVTTDSNILTLSTCIKNKADQRYLVAAVLVADGR